MSSAMTLTLRDRYLAVKTRRHWHSWPVIRHWRTLRYRRLQPVDGGKSSGLSTIRYYWADFLEQNRADIRGHVLEIGETATVRAFGGEAITQADALDLAPHSPEVRVVADLSRADHVPGEVYDCFVNQFTTCVIYDIDAALYHAIRLLKPGGVLLINFWCLDFYLHRGLDMGTGAPLYMHHWFTPINVHDRLRRLGLGEADYQLSIHGNLLTRLAFLLNIPAQEYTERELRTVDPGQPLLICARIVRPLHWQAERPTYCEPSWIPAVRPASMQSDTGHYGDEYQ
jgi:SAM-dependent methyltransferase